MTVKDSSGRPVELSTYGKYEDDIQIDSAYYTDTPIDEEVSDAEIEYIYKTYHQELYEDWYDNKVAQAEAYSDAMEDR